MRPSQRLRSGGALVDGPKGTRAQLQGLSSEFVRVREAIIPELGSGRKEIEVLVLAHTLWQTRGRYRLAEGGTRRLVSASAAGILHR